jgi:hypothetical protein
MISAVRMARMPEPHKATLKRTLLADMTAVLAERPDLATVKLADGADDNWSYLSSILPQGIEILDFYHAAEHLNAAVGSVYGDGSVEARKRFEALRFTLREGKPSLRSDRAPVPGCWQQERGRRRASIVPQCPGARSLSEKNLFEPEPEPEPVFWPELRERTGKLLPRPLNSGTRLDLDPCS